MGFLDNTGITDLVTYLRSKFASLVGGLVAVSQGGTGKGTHTANAVLTGNGTSAVNNVSTADGALYATAANGAAQFGTLPVAQGGTAGTTEAEARTSLEVPVNAAIAAVEGTTATANHAIGDHFMLDDKLKKATAAIATGETISATNSADDTVQGQIDTLRDSVGKWYVVNAQTVITPNEGFRIGSNGSYQHSGIQKVLDCAMHSSSSFSSSTYIGTLSEDARPRGNWAFFTYVNGKPAYITLYGENGAIQIDTLGNTVPANTNIWLRTLYA